MAPDPADHAYAHCVAVLIYPDLAEEAGREALRRGGWTVTGVLAHARQIAVQQAASSLGSPAEPAGFPGSGPVADAEPVDVGTAPLAAVARWLSATRPPVERAIVDLKGRHGLDPVRFARTLGLSPTAAANMAAAVTEAWAAALDPALVARLGPGRCEELGQVLAGRGLAWTTSPGAASSNHDDAAQPGAGEPKGLGQGGPDAGGAESESSATAPTQDPAVMTMETLLAAVPAVAAHVQACERCQDRVRAMVSVQDLVVGIPLEAAPDSVRVVRQDPARRRRRVPPPPPIVPIGARRPWRRTAIAGALVGALAAVVAGGAAIAERRNRDSHSDRVRALTKLPPTNALGVAPTTIVVPGGAFVLTNLSGRTLQWRAASPVPWLSLDPGSGSLGPHGRANLTASLGRGAPGGPATATIAIAGDDGSVTAVRVSTTGAGFADLAASVTACTITATAEAPQGIAGVVLHWLPVPAGRPNGGSPSTTVVPTDRSTPASKRAAIPAPRARSDEHIIAMVKGDTGYTATLPATTLPIQWWVAAADANGDQAQTTPEILPPGSCT